MPTTLFIVKGAYEFSKVANKIKEKFIKLNIDQFRGREIEYFYLKSDESCLGVKFIEDKNIFSVSIKFKYYAWSEEFDLTLFDIEEYPKFIFNKVVNFFTKDGLDLSNEPIFQDADFSDINVQKNNGNN